MAKPFRLHPHAEMQRRVQFAPIFLFSDKFFKTEPKGRYRCTLGKDIPRSFLIHESDIPPRNVTNQQQPFSYFNHLTWNAILSWTEILFVIYTMRAADWHQSRLLRKKTGPGDVFLGCYWFWSDNSAPKAVQNHNGYEEIPTELHVNASDMERLHDEEVKITISSR